MIALRKNNLEQLMIFIDCETQMKPSFTNGEFQIVKEKGFMSVTKGKGTHLVQAKEVTEKEYAPIGWTRIRKESNGLSYYKKLPVEIEKVEPNQKVEILSIDNLDKFYDYDTSKGGYILSNSKEDRYFVPIEEFDKLYNVAILGMPFEIGDYVLELKLVDSKEAYEVWYDGEVQGYITAKRPIYEITEHYLKTFFFN